MHQHRLLVQSRVKAYYLIYNISNMMKRRVEVRVGEVQLRLHPCREGPGRRILPLTDKEWVSGRSVLLDELASGGEELHRHGLNGGGVGAELDTNGDVECTTHLGVSGDVEPLRGMFAAQMQVSIFGYR